MGFRFITALQVQFAQSVLGKLISGMGKVTFEDEEMEEPTEFSDLLHDCRELWMVTQDDTAPMGAADAGVPSPNKNLLFDTGAPTRLDNIHQ